MIDIKMKETDPADPLNGILTVTRQGNQSRALALSIKGMLKVLISVYSKMADEQYAECRKDLPGNWFGLQEISFSILDDYTCTTKTTYRMDRDICDVLAVPHGATCHGICVEGNLISAGYDHYDHSAPQLAEIEKLVAEVMSAQLMKTV